MPTAKQYLASRRNWNKARVITISSIQTDRTVFTDDEINMLQQIKSLVICLLHNWDDNTVELGFNHTPKKEIECH